MNQWNFFSIWLAVCLSSGLHGDETVNSHWDCCLQSPGGCIRFIMEFDDSMPAEVYIVNGVEKIKIPNVQINDHRLEIDFRHYDSKISATIDGNRMVGRWRKRTGRDEFTQLKFKARRSQMASETATTTTEIREHFSGRWAIQFEKSDDPAVGIFHVNATGSADGTFLTTTGDYRYLHGNVVGRQLELSCFDGAHAFLFRAKLSDSLQLSGEFWSADKWHESWQGIRDDNAKLPDSFCQTRVIGERSGLGQYQFPDLSGRLTRLDDDSFRAKARIIYIFGSWCPNCHDAAAYFKHLRSQYSPEELHILGLAFELTGDFARDARQIEEYRKRHQVDYPILIAGLKDKEIASQKLPFLDRVRSYPTTLFLNEHNEIIATHTGFSGPANPDAYQEQQRKFDAIVKTLLGKSS